MGAIRAERQADGDVGMAPDTITIALSRLGAEEALLLVPLGGMAELDVRSAGNSDPPRSASRRDGGVGDLVGHVGSVEGADVGLGDGPVGVLVELLPVQGGVGPGDLPDAEASVKAEGGHGAVA